jgi:molybdate transport system substrate-binding protein
LSELMNVPGIDVLGPLPDDIQSITVFCGAVSSGCKQPEQARALLAYLAGPEATGCKRANGMDAA